MLFVIFLFISDVFMHSVSRRFCAANGLIIFICDFFQNVQDYPFSFCEEYDKLM